MNENFFNVDVWEEVNKKVLRAGALAGTLLDFSDAIRARKGIALKEVLAEHHGFAPAVLGGVDKDGKYGEASLGSLISKLFGADVDALQYCAHMAVSGQDAESVVSLRVQEDTKFDSALRFARSFAESALKLWGESGPPPTNGESLLDEPLKAIETAQELLQTLADLSPGVNEYATFLYMTRRITWRYLIATLPVVQEAQQMAFLERRIGLERVWEPSTNPEGGYTLWGYRDYGKPEALSYGGSILNLGLLAWDLFDSSLGDSLASALIVSPPNLHKVYCQHAKAQLERVHKPENPFRGDYFGDGVRIDGAKVIPFWNASRSRRGNYSPYSERPEEAKSLYYFLDWIIPSVCYGESGLTIEDDSKIGVTRSTLW